MRAYLFIFLLIIFVPLFFHNLERINQWLKPKALKGWEKKKTEPRKGNSIY